MQFSTRDESGRKYAKLGNAKVKSAITIIAAVLLLLYVASVGVSASQNSPSAKTTTSTVTTTSFVCCESTTTTVTLSTKTVTTTLSTQPPDVTNFASSLEIIGALTSTDQIFSAPTASFDCALTVTFSTTGLLSGNTVSLISTTSNGNQNFDNVVVQNSDSSYTVTLSTNTLSIGFHVTGTTTIIYWSYTAICPPAPP